jgi:hypothetical protein
MEPWVNVAQGSGMGVLDRKGGIHFGRQHIGGVLTRPEKCFVAVPAHHLRLSGLRFPLLQGQWNAQLNRFASWPLFAKRPGLLAENSSKGERYSVEQREGGAAQPAQVISAGQWRQ